jgi:hypothetical protein
LRRKRQLTMYLPSLLPPGFSSPSPAPSYVYNVHVCGASNFPEPPSRVGGGAEILIKPPSPYFDADFGRFLTRLIPHTRNKFFFSVYKVNIIRYVDP